MPIMHDSRLDRIRELSEAYSALQQDLPHLETRIALLRAVVADEADDPGVGAATPAQHRYELGNALYERFMHVHEIGDLSEAEAQLRPPCAMAPSSSGLGRDSVLGSVLRERAYETHNHSLAREALSLHRQSLMSGVGLSGIKRACYYRELGLTLNVHYVTSAAQKQSLVESVQQLKAAYALFVKLGVADHVCSAALIQVLIALDDPQAHLTEASSIGDLALTQCGANHRDYYRVVASVSVLRRCLALYNDVPTLPKSLALLPVVIAGAPSGWAPPLVMELAYALNMHFLKHGREEDLSEAIAQLTSVLDGLGPEGLRWDRLQLTLAHMLRARFEMTGSADDIEDATRAAQLALSGTSVGTLPHLGALVELGRCAEDQYRSFGDVAQLNRCIAFNEQIAALPASQAGSRYWAERDLLNALRLRAEATRCPSDLDRAIQLIPASIRSLQFGRYDTQCILHDVGNIFLLRF
jgi:hypothetical protein